MAINLLIFLTAGELHGGGIDDDDVIAGVDEGGVGGFVLALKQLGGQRGHATQGLGPAASMTCHRLVMVFGVATYVRMRMNP